MPINRLAKYLSFFMVISLLFVTLVSIASADGPDDVDLPELIYKADGTIDVGPRLRAQDAKLMAEFEALTAGMEVPKVRATTNYTVGDTVNWLGYDSEDPMHKNFLGPYYETAFEVKYINSVCEVWVQKDVNYYNADGSPNIIHPDAGDFKHITEARIKYLGDACNDIIVPVDKQFFGAYHSHDGSHSVIALINSFLGTTLTDLTGQGDRLVLLVMNVRDENYYDPINNPSFIGGFYSPTFEAWGDRNFMTIDSKQWNDRVGPTGHPTRAYQFDSTIAHELQHLIHDDYDSAEDSWVNEGLSEYAEFLVGYRITPDHGRTQWQLWPENSLVMWGDQNNDQGEMEILADYQLAYFFMLYTAGRLGGTATDLDNMAKLTNEEGAGIIGFNAWLQSIGSNLTFAEIFHDFRFAMLHGDDTDAAQAQTLWNANFVGQYRSPLEMAGGPPTVPLYTGLLRDSLDSQGYSTSGAPPYGSDYLQINWSGAISASQMIHFDGDEAAAGAAWSETTVVTATGSATNTTSAADPVWYSGHGDLEDNFAIFGPFTISSGDKLTFDHFYNIEVAWDYGFVQVTTDVSGLSGWQSLPLSGTMSITDSSAHPIIKANVPGFSGNLTEWEQQSYDLSRYAGQQILMGFRYSTNWGFAGNTGAYPPGWVIDNVMVGSTAATNPRSIHEVRDAGNKFAVNFVTYTDSDGVDLNQVYTMTIDNATQAGSLDLGAIAGADSGFDGDGERGVLLITSQPPTFPDLIGGGLIAKYAGYILTNLPPSLNTEAKATGTSAGSSIRQAKVYPGGLFTMTITLENVGASSEDISRSGGALDVVSCSAIPETVTAPEQGTAQFVPGSIEDGAVLVNSMQTVSANFPDMPGVCFTGLVTESHVYAYSMQASTVVTSGQNIVVKTYSTLAAGTSTVEMVETSIEVERAFANSGYALTSALPGRDARFTLSLVNLDNKTRDVEITFGLPANSTLKAIRAGGNVVSTSSNTVNQSVKPYATDGVQDVILIVSLDPALQEGDTIASTADIKDLANQEVVSLDASGKVGASISIVSPAEGQGFSAGDLTVATVPIEIETTNFVVGEIADPDVDGHWHLWVDGMMIGPVTAYTTEVSLAVGTHVISAELRSPSHEVLGPVDTVNIIVRGQSVRTAEFTPTGGGSVTSTDGAVTVSAPAGAVSLTTTVTLSRTISPARDTKGVIYAGIAFEISAVDANGNPVTTLNQPFTLTLWYLDSEWQGAGLTAENQLKLFFWNGAQWRVYPCPSATCAHDTTANTFTLTITRLSDFRNILSENVLEGIVGQQTGSETYIPILRR